MFQVYTVMAFVDNSLGGNAAGVCLLDTPISADKMQQIAQQVNYSETVFIQLLDNHIVSMRYFTPTEEVDLCGHATLAGFHWLSQRNLISIGTYTLATKNLNLTVTVDSDQIFMEQPPAVIHIIPENYKAIIYALSTGIDSSVALYSASTGIVDLMLPFIDGEALAAFKPDFKQLSEVCIKIGVQGVHAYAPYSVALGVAPVARTPMAETYWVRNFAPLLGIDEESATGTSNCALSGLLAQLGNPASEFCFYQGMWMNAPSIIRTRRQDDLIFVVGGQCRVADLPPLIFH